MSDWIIKVENLGKKYRIQHQGDRQRYTALRDVIAEKAKGFFRKLKPETGNLKSSQVSGLKSQVSSRSASEDFWALKDVSFEVKQGDVVGIIGRNGAGKSTLLKILSRITEPTEGRVRIRGRVASLLEVGTGFHPELTGRENIFLNGAILGMHRVEIKKKFDEIVAFAEVEKFLDTPVKRYSSGMYVRLAFAVAAHLEPEILIVDEVLAVGDAEFQKKCLGKMQDVSKGGRTVLFVSHNMAAVRQLCASALILHQGKVKFIGKTVEAINAYCSNNDNNYGYIDCRSIQRGGSGKIRILSLRTLNSEGKNISDFSIGDDLILEVSIEKTQPTKSVRFNIQVSTPEGLKVASVVDLDSGFLLANPENNEIINVTFKDIRFYPGSYLISLWIGDAAGSVFDTYDNLENCLQFDILDGGFLTTRPLTRNSGLIFLTPKWERRSSPKSSIF